MSEFERPRTGADTAEEAEQGLLDRVRGRVATETERARRASDQHVTVAVPFRAAERT